MRNEIRQLEDGTFEIGSWTRDADANIVFHCIASADDLEEARKTADECDDEDFKFAKSNIDLIGGITAAKKILNQFKKNDAAGVLFPKNGGVNVQPTFLDLEGFLKFVEDENVEPNNDFVLLTEVEIEYDLHQIRFLTF